MAEENKMLAEDAEGAKAPVTPEFPEEGSSRQPEGHDSGGEDEPSESVYGEDASVMPESPESETFYESKSPDFPDAPEEGVSPEAAEAVVPGATAADAQKTVDPADKPEKKKRKKWVGLLAGLLHRRVKTADPYNMVIHGSLVHADIPEGYTLVEQYLGCARLF